MFSGAGTLDKGRNTLLWDGKNSSTGAQEPDGIYTIRVTAKNSEGKAMTAETRSVGYVSGFETGKDGSILLNVGDTTVRYDEVLTVRTPTRAVFEETPSDNEDNEAA